MKHKKLIISTILLFLIVNSSYFWEGKIGMYEIPVAFILAAIFFILCFLLLRQFALATPKKFEDKQWLSEMAAIFVLLLLIFLKPHGIMKFDNLQAKDLLVAEREGAANCQTVLRLDENSRFRQRSVCFSIEETEGNYDFKNDTIFFKDVKYARNENSFYEYGIIRPTKFSDKKVIADLLLYKNHADTAGYVLWITKNDLTK